MGSSKFEVCFLLGGMMNDIKKVVLAYSGGLDTSVILEWIKDTYNAEVITFTADLGQGEEVREAKEKALRTGALKAYAIDLQNEFVEDFVYPVLRAGAIYEGYYLLGTSFARPLIAREMIKIAEAEGADAVAHGATGKGNDQVRFELSAYALNPDIKVIAPWREWNFKSRDDLLAYAKERKIDIVIPEGVEKPYSTDANLFHISYEGGILEDPWAEPPEDMWTLTVDPEKAPNEAEIIELEYENGDAISLNGKKLSPLEMLRETNKIAGKHGIGRVDIVENRFVGMKSRGCYESPGGTILYHAHKAMEQITLDRKVLEMRDSLIPRYSSMVYNGFWYAPEREVLQNMMDDIQKEVSGTVRLKLYKGNIITLGRKSLNSLYREDVVTFEEDHVYEQVDADGFIKLNALRLRIRKQLKDGIINDKFSKGYIE